MFFHVLLDPLPKEKDNLCTGLHMYQSESTYLLIYLFFGLRKNVITDTSIATPVHKSGFSLASTESSCGVSVVSREKLSSRTQNPTAQGSAGSKLV